MTRELSRSSKVLKLELRYGRDSCCFLFNIWINVEGLQACVYDKEGNMVPQRVKPLKAPWGLLGRSVEGNWHGGRNDEVTRSKIATTRKRGSAWCDKQREWGC